MAESTNRILFAIVIMLFAIVFALISTGWGFVVMVIALVGLGFGLYGLFGKAIAEAMAESREQR
ncbi:MAG TPA: hypothetical protein VJO13_07975 [Ktedonobacterales bacterium]|nr:hypothetical protein [Ktedonobacterales bacterium]